MEYLHCVVNTHIPLPRELVHGRTILRPVEPADGPSRHSREREGSTGRHREGAPVSLRTKAWLIFGVVMLGLVAAVLLILEVGVLRSFSSLEESAVRREVHRALRAIDAEAAHLDKVVLDWAEWDPSYDFLDTREPEYIRVNLNEDTYRSLDLSLLAFVRFTGEVTWGLVFEASTERLRPISPEGTQQLVSIVDTLVHSGKAIRARGVFPFPDATRIIAIRPILRSDASGPPRGVLVMGRTLGSELVAHLGATLDLELTTERSDALPPGSDFALVAPRLDARQRITTLPPKELTISGFGLLQDLNGRPAMVLRVVQDREIAAQGRAITRYLLLLLVSAMAVTALAVQLLLERGVIARLATLGDRLREIGRLADTTARVEVSGRDEVSQLGAGINGMLTALQSAQASVRASEKRYRAVVEDQAELICRWRPSGEIVFSNRAYARYFAPAADGAGDGRVPASRHAHATLVATAISLTAEEPAATVLLEHPGDGKARWVQWSNQALFDADGALAEVQSVGRDVTRQQELGDDAHSRARLEAALRDAQDAFLDLSRSVNSVVWICAAAPAKVTYVNPAYEHVWGRTCESLYEDPESYLLGFHPDDRGLVATCDAGGRVTNGADCELRLVRPDGSQRWVHLRRFPLGDHANGERVIYLAEDISERKRIEAQSRQLEAQLRLLARRLDGAREAERRKLATWIHDEIGQMLTALRMDLAWLQKRLRPRSPEVQAAFAEMDTMIARNVGEVQHVTAELRPAVLEDLGLLPAMEWLIDQMRRRSQLRVEFRASLGEATLAAGTSLALFRILQEALTNVVRHADASEVGVDLGVIDGAITLRVGDNGRGIRQEEVSGPAALGILGMRERVLAHGGSLVIETGVEGGTLLTATIPGECHTTAE